MNEEQISKNNNIQTPTNNELIEQPVSEKTFLAMNDNPKKEAMNNTKTIKHKKTWIIIAIVVSILIVTSIGKHMDIGYDRKVKL